MADRTVRFILTGDSAGAVKAMAETGAAADTAATEMGDKLQAGSDRVGGIFGKLGNTLSNWGLPFGNSVAKVGDKFTAAETSGQKFGAAMSTLGGATLAGAAVGFAAAGVESVKMAGNFQTAMTQLVTGAGESEKNIGMVSQGILNMAGQVGISAQDLASGMYMIESAGYHGAAGLDVLKAASEGAAVGGADMSTVASAVTTALTDYHMPASKAADVTSALVETVASGKMHMEDLALSLGKVMPVASALGLNLQNVTGAMAAMTNQGLSARFAATHLQTTLLAMSAPSSVATKAMDSVGLTSQQVKNTLDGPGGIGAALTLIEGHVGAKFPKSSVQYVTAMKDMLGGTTGYATALMLSGKNMAAFQDNVKNIGDSLDKGSQQVQGFNKVQGDLKFQEEQLKATVDSLAIKFGDFLIPKLEMAGKAVADVVSWFEKNKVAAEILGAAIAGPLALAVGIFAVDKIGGLVKSISGAIDSVGQFGLKLLGLADPAAAASTSAEEAGTAAETMGTEAEAGSAQAQLAFEGMSTGATEMSTVVKTESATAGVAVDEMAATTDAAATSMDAAIGSTGLGLILIGLGLAVTLLLTHWKEVWGGIKDAAKAVWDFLKTDVFDAMKDYWQISFVEPLNIAKGVWDTVWGGIKSAASTVWNFLSGSVFDPIKNFFETVLTNDLNAIKKTWDTVWGGIKSTVQDVWNVIKPIFDDIGNAVSSITGAISKIDSAAHTAINDLNPLHWAGSGAIVTQPTIMGVGESGPEAIIPLSMMGPNGIAALSGNGVSPLPSGVGGTAAVGHTVNVNVQSGASPQEIGTEVSWALKLAS